VKLETLTDEEHIVLVYLNSRVMRLSLKDSLPFLLAVQRNMKSNLKLDIEIGRITSSMMVENVAAYVRKTVSHLLIKDRDSILYSLKSHRGRKRRRRGHAIMFSVVQRKLHGF
jgi:hypothetical protein